MLPLAVALTLLAADRPSVAVVGFKAVGVAPEKVASIAESFALELATTTPALKVTSSEAIAAVLGAERQRLLLGCSDEASSSCLSEMLGALGPAHVISGSVVKLGERLSLSLRVSSARDGHLVYGQQAFVDSAASALEWFQAQAPLVGDACAVDLKLAVAPRVSKPSNAGAIAATVVAGLAAVSAVTFFILLDSETRAFKFATTLQGARSHAEAGAAFQVVAWTSLGVGLAAGVTAALLWVLPPSPVKVGVVFGATNQLTVGGAF